VTIDCGGEGQKVHSRQNRGKTAPLEKTTVSGRAKNYKDSSLGGTAFVVVVVVDFYYCRGKWTGNSND